MSNDSKDATKQKEQALTQGAQLARALDWIVNDKIFVSIALHGSVRWTVAHLVRVAILWVWNDERKLVVSANDAIAKTTEIWSWAGIHSYQVLTNALKRYGSAILACLLKRMHALMEKTSPADFRIGSWLALAVDGSRLDTPRTRANEARFCKSASQRKKNKKSKKKTWTIRDQEKTREQKIPLQSSAGWSSSLAHFDLACGSANALGLEDWPELFERAEPSSRDPPQHEIP